MRAQQTTPKATKVDLPMRHGDGFVHSHRPAVPWRAVCLALLLVMLGAACCLVASTRLSCAPAASNATVIIAPQVYVQYYSFDATLGFYNCQPPPRRSRSRNERENRRWAESFWNPSFTFPDGSPSASHASVTTQQSTQSSSQSQPAPGASLGGSPIRQEQSPQGLPSGSGREPVIDLTIAQQPPSPQTQPAADTPLESPLRSQELSSLGNSPGRVSVDELPARQGASQSEEDRQCPAQGCEHRYKNDKQALNHIRKNHIVVMFDSEGRKIERTAVVGLDDEYLRGLGAQGSCRFCGSFVAFKQKAELLAHEKHFCPKNPEKGQSFREQQQTATNYQRFQENFGRLPAELSDAAFRAAVDAWAADKVLADDSVGGLGDTHYRESFVHVMGRSIREVPAAVQPTVARVFGKAFSRIVKDLDDLAAWKLLFGLPSMLFMPFDKNCGMSQAEQMTLRCARLLAGQLTELFDPQRWCQPFKTGADPSGRRREREVDKTRALIIDGQLSKAARMHASDGVAVDPNGGTSVSRMIADRCPQGCLGENDFSNERDQVFKPATTTKRTALPHSDKEQADREKKWNKVVQTARRMVAPGPSGLRVEHFKFLWKFNKSALSNIFEAVERLDLPIAVMEYGAMTSLVALLKRDPAEPDAPPKLENGVRPIGIGECLIKMGSKPRARAAIGKHGEALAAEGQFGNFSAGIEAVPRAISLLSGLSTKCALWSKDIYNAFQEMSRKQIFACLKECDNDLYLYALAYYAKARKQFMRRADGVVEFVCLSVQGFTQGDILAAILFDVVYTYTVLRPFNEKFRSRGVTALAIHDDSYLHGPTSELLEANEYLQQLCEKLRLVFNVKKEHLQQQALCAPDSQGERCLGCNSDGQCKACGLTYGDTILKLREVDGSGRSLSRDTPIHGCEYALRCGGVPVGSAEAVQKRCESMVDEYIAALTKLSALVKAGLEPEFYWMILHYCTSPRPRFNHAVRAVVPSLTIGAARKADDAITEAVADMLASGTSEPVAGLVQKLGRKTARRLQLNMPRRNGGLGVASIERLREAAFLASMIDTIPAIAKIPAIAELVQDPRTWADSAHRALREAHEAFRRLLDLGVYFKEMKDCNISKPVWSALCGGSAPVEQLRAPDIVHLGKAAGMRSQKAFSDVVHNYTFAMALQDKVGSGIQVGEDHRVRIAQCSLYGSGVSLFRVPRLCNCPGKIRSKQGRREYCSKCNNRHIDLAAAVRHRLDIMNGLKKNEIRPQDSMCLGTNCRRVAGRDPNEFACHLLKCTNSGRLLDRHNMVRDALSKFLSKHLKYETDTREIHLRVKPGSKMSVDLIARCRHNRLQDLHIDVTGLATQGCKLYGSSTSATYKTQLLAKREAEKHAKYDAYFRGPDWQPPLAIGRHDAIFKVFAFNSYGGIGAEFEAIIREHFKAMVEAEQAEGGTGWIARKQELQVLEELDLAVQNGNAEMLNAHAGRWKASPVAIDRVAAADAYV